MTSFFRGSIGLTPSFPPLPPPSSHNQSVSSKLVRPEVLLHQDPVLPDDRLSPATCLPITPSVEVDLSSWPVAQVARALGRNRTMSAFRCHVT